MTTTRRAEDIKAPPREQLLRMAPFGLRAEGDGQEDDGLTLDGFAAAFNRETIIDSWEGKFREKISPGSMKKSFRERPPRIQFDHGRHPLVGSIPIASLRSIAEEVDPELAPEGGAHVIGRLHDNWLIEPVRDAIASRSIDGMSFRFHVVREKWYGPDGKEIRDDDELIAELRRTWYEDVPEDELLLRDLRELKVPELGPVVWPAYGSTSVGVRSETVTVDLGRLDDPDQRMTLARAVFLADAAERLAGEEPQPTDDDERAEEDDAPTESAGEHEEATTEEEDEPRATEGTAPAGEHPSRQTPPASPYAIGPGTADWYLPAR